MARTINSSTRVKPDVLCTVPILTLSLVTVDSLAISAARMSRSFSSTSPDSGRLQEGNSLKISGSKTLCAVNVGVGVGVAVGVAVRVGVEVQVAVWLGTEVEVSVGVAVAVGV
jgi:hypothetical protein